MFRPLALLLLVLALPEGKKLDSTDVALMYSRMGHPTIVSEGTYITLDQKRQPCVFILVWHNGGKVLCGEHKSKEGKIIRVISMPDEVPPPKPTSPSAETKWTPIQSNALSSDSGHQGCR
jgi:hypothetical protein